MKKILTQILLLVLLAAAILGVFWFNGSSASRSTVFTDPDDKNSYVPDPTPEQSGNTVPPAPGVTEPPENTVTPTVPVIDPAREAFEQFMQTLYTASAAKDAGYEEATTLQGEKTLITYQAKLSGYASMFGPAESKILTVYYRFVAGIDYPVFRYGEGSAPSLMLYGGHLIAHSSGKQYLLDPILGGVVCDISECVLGYCLDSEGRAIFLRDGGYYYFDMETGSMVPTVRPENRFLFFDYTPDYGIAQTDLTPFMDEDSGKWGYRNAEGKVVIKASYYRAFPFSKEGVAAVQKNKQDGLLFLDTTGKVVCDSHLRYYDLGGNPAFDWYRAPEDLSGASVGSMYFDGGYMWVQADTYALSDSTKVLFSRQVLVDVAGNELPLPSDYTICGYSDGVVTLSKNGCYGYYSVVDRCWIVDPIYAKASPFNGGIGVVQDKDGNYFAFDTKGQMLIPSVFDYLSAPSMGKLLAYRADEGWMILSVYAKTDETKEEITEE